MVAVAGQWFLTQVLRWVGEIFTTLHPFETVPAISVTYEYDKEI